jgi:chemotaxis protein MotB
VGKKKHAEHVNHERWLVSYADLLTLLFAFFVVLFASSVSDKKKTAQMAAAMQTAFTEHGVFEAHASSPPLESGGGNSEGAPAPLMEPLPTAPGSAAGSSGSGSGKGNGSAAAKAVQQHMQQALANALTNGTATVHQSTEGLTISLHEAGFFSSGTAEINPKMMALLAQVAASLPDRDLRVEGHTDNLPIRSGRYRSNFELSTARAAAIAEVLMARSHISPARFALAGYGPYRPATGNDTAEGRAQNRRVDIVLLGTGSLPAQPVEQASARQLTQKDTLTGTGTKASVASTQLRDVPFARQNLAAAAAAAVTAPAPRTLQLATDADRAAANHN